MLQKEDQISNVTGISLKVDGTVWSPCARQISLVYTTGWSAAMCLLQQDCREISNCVVQGKQVARAITGQFSVKTPSIS